MYMYFPTNYVWSLGVVATLNNGGYIDEVDRACRPVLEAAQRGDDAGTEELYAAWAQVANQVISSAEEDEAAGRIHTAAGKYYRGSLYTAQSERLQSPKWEGRNAAYQRSMDLLLKHVELAGVPLTTVEIPFEDSSMPGYFYRAESVDGKPTPIVIQWNGLDSTKEMMYTSGFPQMLAQRGISTLMVDTPGSGQALRHRNLKSRHDSEVWATAIIDWLEGGAIKGLDLDKIGIVGWSLGGYYAPRAAAFEKRIKLAVAWGANHNWAEVQEGRRQREGENPVPHYWDHVFWVFGASDMEDFKVKTANMHLNGVADKITCSLLVTHGIGDRQINVKYAHQTYEQAVNAKKVDLKIFEADEGGVEHISIDNMPYAAAYTADWVERTFLEL